MEVLQEDNKFLLAALTEEGRTKWCEVLEENMSVKSFEVTPEDYQSLSSLGDHSWDHCFLQISSSELKLKSGSKEVVSWPFSCIRRYKCRNGVFLVEVGRKAPSGQGVFPFQTQKPQQIFENLDRAVKDRLRNKDSMTSDFGEISTNPVAKSGFNFDIKKGRRSLESRSDRDQQNTHPSKQEEYNHLNFSQMKSQRPTEDDARFGPIANDDMYNHLSSARKVSHGRERHRASDFGLPYSSNLQSSNKLSKSMSSLTSITSCESSEQEYSYLASVETIGNSSVNNVGHIDELKRALSGQSKVHNQSYISPKASLVAPVDSTNEQHYDRLHGTKPASLVSDSYRENIGRRLHLPINNNLTNEYDCLNKNRSLSESGLDGVPTPLTEDHYNHLKANMSWMPSPSSPFTHGLSSPPKPPMKVPESQSPVTHGSNSTELDENLYSVPGDPVPATSMPPRVAPKPEVRSKPLPAVPSSCQQSNYNVPRVTQRPVPVARPRDIQTSNIPNSPPSPPAVSAPLVAVSPNVKSPTSPKSPNKTGLCTYPGGGIGQAIAQAGLVAQLKKNLVVSGFTPLKATEDVPSPEPQSVRHDAPKKPLRQMPSKSQPIYAVSPFGKDIVEAAENQYINVENSTHTLPGEYDQVGGVMEGEYYEAMNSYDGYNQVGDTVSCGSAENLYDVPRGEGIC